MDDRYDSNYFYGALTSLQGADSASCLVRFLIFIPVLECLRPRHLRTRSAPYVATSRRPSPEMAGDEEDDKASSRASESVEDPISLIPSQDIATWLINKQFLLSAYELWFELEDSRDAADPTEPQARNKLRDYFKDPKRFPPKELAGMATQDGALIAVQNRK